MRQKIALITGATSGIGRATAEALAIHHFDLILCGRNEQPLGELAQLLSPQCRVHTMRFDVRSEQEVQGAFDALPTDWQEVDVLVNNAGGALGLDSVECGKLADWKEMLDANVWGLLLVSRRVLPSMVARQRGHIVNVSSVAGKQTYANGAVYCATKKSVEAISEGMRLDLTGKGIKVTNIAPGAVETMFSVRRFHGDEQRAKQVYEGFTPLQAKDIADAIVFCVNAPEHVTIADMTIYAKAQAAPTVIYRHREE